MSIVTNLKWPQMLSFSTHIKSSAWMLLQDIRISHTSYDTFEIGL